MKRIVVVLEVAALMTAALALGAGTALSQTSPSGTLDANTLPISTSTDRRSLIAELNPATAQTFTAENSGELTSAQIQAYKVCEAAEDVRMHIATVDSNGLPTDNIIAETTVPASAFSTESFFTGLGDLVLVE